jgi:hypothetical protein
VPASALLQARCPQMSVQSYRLALVLRQSGARSRYMYACAYMSQEPQSDFQIGRTGGVEPRSESLQKSVQDEKIM